MSDKVYGRAYPISQKDAKAYRRVDRSLRANPIGVTAMAAVNGRGAARSARAVAHGKTRSERIKRAEQVYRNGEKPMAGILKNRKAKASTSAKKKSSPAKRTKIAGTNYYKTKGGRYQNAKGKYVKEAVVKSARKRASTKRPATAKRAAPKRTAAKRAAPRKRTTKRAVRKNASVGYSASYSKGYDRVQRSAAGKKAAATRKRRQRAASSSAGRATTVGKYKRVRIKDPRTGKMKLSYMYETSGGKLRKIPTSAITRSGHKSATEIKRGRSKAAARIKKEGSAFVANRSGKATARQKRAGRRLAAFMAAKRSGKTVAQAKSAALRKVPLARGDQFKGTAKAPVTTKKRVTKVRRNKRGASATKRVRRNGKRKSTKRGVVANAKRRTTKRRTTAKKSPARRRTVKRKTIAKRRTTKRRSTAKRKTTRRTTKRRTTKRRASASPVRRKRRSTVKRKTTRRRVRRNGSIRTYRKNAFMANLQAVLKTGLFITAGFMSHRVLTNLVADKALATTLAENQAFTNWKKPIVGFGVLLVGIPAVGAIAPKRAIEIGGGMVASFLQSLVVTALRVQSEPNADILAAVSGYSNSRAYALRGTKRRRRGLRGGMERHATSIMPRYVPLGQYEQAAAGFQQAAAGSFQQAAAGSMGEYFSATRGLGEYFAATGEYFSPKGMKGVGGYEPAGQLAMQASAGARTVIHDGLRPDGDIDRALDVAEAAAGLGDVAVEHRVAQQSQWIPNGPLWAGERPVQSTQATSEVSAGILQRQGGNGILSAG